MDETENFREAKEFRELKFPMCYWVEDRLDQIPAEWETDLLLKFKRKMYSG